MSHERNKIKTQLSYILGYREFKASKIFYLTCLI